MPFSSLSAAMSTYKRQQSIVAQAHPRLMKTDSTPAHCEALYIKDGMSSGYTYESRPQALTLVSLKSSHTYKKGKGHVRSPTKVIVIRRTSLELLCIPILNAPLYEDTSSASFAEWGHMHIWKQESAISDPGCLLGLPQPDPSLLCLLYCSNTSTDLFPVPVAHSRSRKLSREQRNALGELKRMSHFRNRISLE